MEKPEIKNGEPITADIFTNIYDTIEEETEKIQQEVEGIDDKYQKDTDLLKYQILCLQDTMMKESRTSRTLWFVVYVLGILIFVLLICIILGVF